MSLNVSQADIVQLFRKYDENGDGTIDIREMQQVMNHIGQPFNDNQWAMILRACDMDRSGTLSYEEFANWLMQSQKQSANSMLCFKCQGAGFVHESSMSHTANEGERCMFCETCDTCSGTGNKTSGMVRCLDCLGKGWEHTSSMPHSCADDEKCMFCSDCDKCGGRGMVQGTGMGGCGVCGGCGGGGCGMSGCGHTQQGGCGMGMQQGLWLGVLPSRHHSPLTTAVPMSPARRAL